MHQATSKENKRATRQNELSGQRRRPRHGQGRVQEQLRRRATGGMPLTTTMTTSTVTSAGYPPPGQQISSPPGPAQTKGVSGDTRSNYNEGDQTPNGNKGESPTRLTQTTMPTSKATSREWEGVATKALPSMGGSPKTNEHWGHARDQGVPSPGTWENQKSAGGRGHRPRARLARPRRGGPSQERRLP